MDAFDTIQATAHKQCIPLNVTIEITLRCNLRCVHCYNFDRQETYRPNASLRDELSDDEIHRIIDETRNEGCMFLGFTGGEALVHPSLDAFISHASELGCFTRLKTNGVLLSEPRTAALVFAGLVGVDLSLYGATATTHDAFVLRAGAFDATVAGARNAIDAGLKTQINISLTEGNATEMEAMVELSEALGAGWSVNSQITDRQDGTPFPQAMRASRETLRLLYGGPLQQSALGGQPHPGSVQCSCARSVAGISAFGDVYPCIGAPLKAGDLRQASFHDVWTGSPVFEWIRALTLQDFPACRDCGLRSLCRRSSGSIFMNSGDYTGPAHFGDDWVCMEAEVVNELAAGAPAIS